MSITHINSRSSIDCADDVPRVINATLGGFFDLKSDGSFTLEPWGCGLTDAGLSFMAMARGKCFSNLLSVLAIIMDGQIGINRTANTRAWVGHMITAYGAVVAALGGESYGLLQSDRRFSLRAMEAARPLIPYCLHRVSDNNPALIILNRDYKPLGISKMGVFDLGWVDYEDYKTAHISPEDAAFNLVTEGLKASRPFNGRHFAYWFWSDASTPRNRRDAQVLLGKIQKLLVASGAEWKGRLPFFA